MIIRNEQMRGFLPNSDEEIVGFIAGHLASESRELIQRLPPTDLREMIANGIKRARSHGLQTMGDLAGFVSIMFAIAPDFDEQPQIRAALADPADAPEDRFASLFRVQFDSAWKDAADRSNARSDAEAWFPELREAPSGG